MRKILSTQFLYFLIFLFWGCRESVLEGNIVDADWKHTKLRARPLIANPNEFSVPYKQALSVGGWEDGIFITRDGLNLYCMYLPADLISFHSTGRGDLSNTLPYRRGPDFGMDMISNPAGYSNWLHADILYARRESIKNPFSTWQLSSLKRSVWIEGAPQFLMKNDLTVDIFVYTSNHIPPDYDINIFIMNKTSFSPKGVGQILPSPVTTIYSEDNPHIERIGKNHLILFFDSDNKPGGLGLHDLWYSTSHNNGDSWSKPASVKSINTENDEHQPHLFQNKEGKWFLYYTATNKEDKKPGIFRAQQGKNDNWDSWINRELVIGAGNTLGVGEPTLTKYGDISFVVIYEKINPKKTDRYDADPWFLPKQDSPAN
jgi:hypothetical protein